MVFLLIIALKMVELHCSSFRQAQGGLNPRCVPISRPKTPFKSKIKFCILEESNLRPQMFLRIDKNIWK